MARAGVGAGPGVARVAAGELRTWLRTDRVGYVAAAWASVLVVVAAARNPVLTSSAAAATYLLLGVYALQLLARETSQPSLGQAAFMGLGAYLTAYLRLRLGLDGLTSALVVAVEVGAVGWGLGWGAGRLGPAALALLTWVFGWLTYIAVGAFPEVSGGAGGVVLHSRVGIRVAPLGIDMTFDDLGHLLMGTVLLGVLLLLYRSAQRSVVGRSWAALRDSRSLASSLGYEVAAIRRGTFAVAAGLAALSGSLGSQMLGVVDPTLFSPVQSLTLFAAVLIGAPLGFFGPLVGAAVAGGLPFAVDQAGRVTGLPLGASRGLLAAAIILLALLVAGRVQRRPATPRTSRRPGSRARSEAHRTIDAGRVETVGWEPGGSPLLEARDLSIRFEGVRALDGVGISVRAGEIHGLIGPNGSGKTTLLRCLSGRLPAQAGTISLAGRPLEGLDEPARVKAGLARTFQRTAVMPHLTVAEHVLAGVHVRQPASGWVRAVLKTPGYRAGELAARAMSASLLATFGLGDLGDQLPEALSSGRQRLLQIATAAATGARVLLLDEPSAGMSTDELALLETALVALARGGTGLLVIEHNMSFLARLASRVTVLDGGQVVAEGTPEAVSRDPGVRRAYLGDGHAEPVVSRGATRQRTPPRRRRTAPRPPAAPPTAEPGPVAGARKRGAPRRPSRG